MDVFEEVMRILFGKKEEKQPPTTTDGPNTASIKRGQSREAGRDWEGKRDN